MNEPRASAPAAAPGAVFELLGEVYKAFATVSAATVRVFEEFEISESLATLLWSLNPTKPPVSMRELARKLRCDPSNVTLLGDRLEKMGLVERVAYPGDGRVRTLVLTEAGLRLWEEFVARAEETTPLRRLTDAEQQQLGELLAKIHTARPWRSSDDGED
jgi:DNA-binding MarR family transcriptional regulator